LAFAEVGRQLVWKGTGPDEVGLDARTGETLVRIDPRYFRLTEVGVLEGDASKARAKLGWQPKTSFHDMVREMVAGDLAEARASAG
jgi:GDPmannose 4,6-dehydratase